MGKTRRAMGKRTSQNIKVTFLERRKAEVQLQRVYLLRG
jgi:hypothetical protein